MERMVYIGEAAHTLGVSRKHLKVLERSGRIPQSRRDGFGDRIYSEWDLEVLRALGVGSRPRRLKTQDEVLAALK